MEGLNLKDWGRTGKHTMRCLIKMEYHCCKEKISCYGGYEMRRGNWETTITETNLNVNQRFSRSALTSSCLGDVKIVCTIKTAKNKYFTFEERTLRGMRGSC
mmetsp:Transcript_29258/g.60949  ORF Transcript_29258/g.60949 Transcript_29258/m.60949 type:complete len:102 (-) Transcript_29258:52-357(-)